MLFFHTYADRINGNELRLCESEISFLILPSSFFWLYTTLYILRYKQQNYPFDGSFVVFKLFNLTRLTELFKGFGK